MVYSSGDSDPDIDKDSPDYIITGLTSGESFNFYPIREHQNTSGKFTVASSAISDHDDGDSKIGSVGNATVVTFNNSFPSNYIKLEPPLSLSVHPNPNSICGGEYSFKDSLNIIDQAGGYIEEYDVGVRGKAGEREIIPTQPLDPSMPGQYTISIGTNGLGSSDYTITNDGSLLFTDPLQASDKITIIFIPPKSNDNDFVGYKIFTRTVGPNGVQYSLSYVPFGAYSDKEYGKYIGEIEAEGSGAVTTVSVTAVVRQGNKK